MNKNDTSAAVPPPALRELSCGPDKCALFLDFDGTLLDLAESPDAIRVPGELANLLRDLARHFGGALAILTGRALADLDRHLPELALAAAGQHGAEWRLAARAPAWLADEAALSAPRAAIRDFAAAHPAVLVEDKGASIALHYRAAPEEKAPVEAFARALVAENADVLELVPGKLLCELRPLGVDKGRALRAFLAQAPFAGRRPLVIGDDVTDEAAFAAAIASGGHAVKVGAGLTRARWRLAGPEAVRAWLAACLGGR